MPRRLARVLPIEPIEWPPSTSTAPSGAPTRLKISAYIKEALEWEFAPALKKKTLTPHLMSFQDPKNRAYVTGYRITGPTLVPADVRDGKVAAWKARPRSGAWSAGRKRFSSTSPRESGAT